MKITRRERGKFVIQSDGPNDFFSIFIESKCILVNQPAKPKGLVFIDGNEISYKSSGPKNTWWYPVQMFSTPAVEYFEETD
ncbi:MAG TPA: hypothetical protein EYP14_14440 [Planctomycetaceae bacterium]|nr:hypothetical protein [Planctomycetaceae bacterium]